MAVTRIKNNQIFDSTVVAYSKVHPGTITGNLFADSVTINSNITITGNLDVFGNTTTINSVNTFVNDPVVTFNNGYTGSLVGYDIGVLVNRDYSNLDGYPGGVNVAWVWDENDAAFEGIATDTTGNAIVGLNRVGFANLKIGNITAINQTITGNVGFGYLTVTNNTVLNGPTQINNTLGVTGLVSFTNANTTQALTVTGGATIGAILTSNGNVVAASGTESTDTTTGALVSTGGLGVATAAFIGGNVNINNAGLTTANATAYLYNENVTTLNIGRAATTIRVGADTGTATIGNPTVVGTQATQNLYNTVATTVNAFGAATTLNVGNASGTTNLSGILKTSGNIVGFATTTTSDVNTGSLVLKGGAGIAGVVIAGGNIVAASGTASTSTTTGALVVNGGVGVSGNITLGGSVVASADLYVHGGDILTNATTFNVINTTATTVNAFGAATTINAGNAGGTTNWLGIFKNNGNIVAAATTASTTVDTGALVVKGGTGIAGVLNVGGNIVAVSTTGSTDTTTGALVVKGGTGIAENLYVGGNETITGDLAVNGGDITTTATTFNLVDATATTVNFAGAATLLDIGATSGTATINNPTLVGTQTTQNLYNTVATTVNAFGAATALNVGASTGTLTIANPTITGTNATTFNLNGANPSIVTTSTGTASVFNTNATTLNVGGAATTISIGAATGNTTINSANVIIAGNLHVLGNATVINTETLNVEDLNITVAANATTPSQANGAGLTVAGANATFTYTAVDDRWNLNKDLNVPNLYGNLYSTTIETTSTIKSHGNVVADSGTASTNTTTGALVVVGGFGISGDTNSGGNATYAGDLAVNGGDVTTTAATFNLINTNATTLNLGAAATTINAGNASGTTNWLGVFKNNGNIVAASGTATTNTTTGALVVNGGVGVSGAVITGGNIVAASGTASTSTTTGALVVTGGTGISGALNVGTTGTFGANIADNGGGLTTTQTTGYLFNETVTTLNVGTAATTARLGATSGTLTLGNPTVVGTQATQALYDTVATTLNFGRAATSLVMGATTGTATIQNPTVVGSQTTQNLWNTVATTVNAFGAATTINAGNTSGTTNWLGVFKNSGNIVAQATTVSADINTGALVVKGGVGIAGVTNAGGNVVISSGTNTTSTTTGALVITSTGGASIGSNLSVGNQVFIGGAGAFGQNISGAAVTSVKSGATFTQFAHKNTSAAGSADYSAFSDTGTDAGGWVDIGIAGTAFNDPLYTITKPEDGYLITRPTSNATGGNLVLSTSEAGSYNDVVVGVGSFHANAEVMRLHGNVSNNGTVVIKLPTNAAPSANTGALQVWGGASFGANVYMDNAVTINGSKTPYHDLIVKGANDNTLIWARPDSVYDSIIVGNSAVVANVIYGAKLQVNTTDTILLPKGTSAQRPGSAGFADVPGMFRFNSTIDSIEWYTDASGWQTSGTIFTIISGFPFNGDGVTNTFVLSGIKTTTASTIVSINGVVQQPIVAYSIVSENTLVFTESPSLGDVIDVRVLSTTQTVSTLASADGTMVTTVDETGIRFQTAQSGIAVTTTYIDKSGAFVGNLANVNITTTTPTVIDTFDNSKYRTAKYIVQVTQGSNYQSQEVLVVSNGELLVSETTYGIVQTGGNLGVIGSYATSGNTYITFTTAFSGNAQVKVKKEYITV